MPTQVGIQRGDDGVEDTALACNLVFPQVGLLVRNNYNFVLVICFSGFPPSRV